MDHCIFMWNILSSKDLSEPFPSDSRNFQWQLQLKQNGKDSFSILLIIVKAPNGSFKVNYMIELINDPMNFMKPKPLEIDVKGCCGYVDKLPETHEITRFNHTGLKSFPTPRTSIPILMTFRFVISPFLVHAMISSNRCTELLNSVLVDREFCDLIIIIGETRTQLYLHRCIFGAASTLYRNFLKMQQAGAESFLSCIEIQDLEPNIFHKVTDFIYKGDTEITDLHMGSELLRAAINFNIQDLKELSSKYIESHVNPENAIERLTLSDENYTNLVELSEKRCRELLNSVLIDRQFSDLSITVGKTDTQFNVHRCILGAASIFFREILKKQPVYKTPVAVIKIRDFEADVFEKIIEFIYKGEIEITDIYMGSELLRAANKYNIQGLKKLSSTYLESKVNQENVIEVLILSDENNASDFKDYVMDYFEKNCKTSGTDLRKLLKHKPKLLKTILLRRKSHKN